VLIIYNEKGGESFPTAISGRITPPIDHRRFFFPQVQATAAQGIFLEFFAV
jgi:hypothetical protein